jgi:predicted TIM-barrel fold metal-dependent hydrolase
MKARATGSTGREGGIDMATSQFAGMTIIDADTHLTEPHDLWTSRSPAAYRDRVPQVRDVDGRATWVVDGITLGRAGASGVVGRDGVKVPGIAFFSWGIEDVHPGAHSVPDRLEMMDEQGIWAEILYPNTVGFGGQRFGAVQDPVLRRLTVEIYNDAMAEIQEQSGGRLVPMGILPFWDVELAVTEVGRMAQLGLRGINTTSAPHEHGLPDLGSPHWDPVWEAASDLGLPVNFHIGASESDMSWYGTVSWPSLNGECKLGLGSAMLYVNNAAVIGNMIYSGVLERFPTLQFVSVESGVGWIPFVLQALDYQIGEMTAGATAHLSMKPSDYFRRQFHSCFWFERQGIAEAIAVLGWEHLLFETDFPHPTCIYPDGLEFAAAALATIDDAEVRRGIMGANAARLYGIALPETEPVAPS